MRNLTWMRRRVSDGPLDMIIMRVSVMLLHTHFQQIMHGWYAKEFSGADTWGLRQWVLCRCVRIASKHYVRGRPNTRTCVISFTELRGSLGSLFRRNKPSPCFCPRLHSYTGTTFSYPDILLFQQYNTVSFISNICFILCLERK